MLSSSATGAALAAALAWMAKSRVSGIIHQKRLGDADDIEPGQGLSYTDAIAAAGKWRDELAVRLSGEKAASDTAASEVTREAATVRGHVGAYLSRREADKGNASARNAHQRLGAHVLSDAIASMHVSALTAADIRSWRGRLLKTTRDGSERTERMSPATEKRLLADVKAALGKTLTTRRGRL